MRQLCTMMIDKITASGDYIYCVKSVYDASLNPPDEHRLIL